MSMRAAFSAEEWTVVTEAPVAAGARLIVADDGGTIRERFAIGQVYSAARELRGESALLDELAEDPPSIKLWPMRGVDDTAAVIDRLRAALAILEARVAPDDIDAYKGFVLAVIQTVAEANREGGFAGIGGEEVSESELAALYEIGALLGVADPLGGE